MNLFNDTPATEALGLLGWENLETQRAKPKAKQMCKIVNGLAPYCLTDLFINKNDISHHKLRDPPPHCRYRYPKMNIEKKKRFCQSEAKLWNSLPATLRR